MRLFAFYPLATRGSSHPKAGSNGYAFTSNWIDKIDAPDAKTFRIITKAPYAWTESQVGNNLIGAIVPKELLASADLKTKPVGGGPFKAAEIKEGAAATLERNPNYYKSVSYTHLTLPTIYPV